MPPKPRATTTGVPLLSLDAGQGETGFTRLAALQAALPYLPETQALGLG